MTADYPAIERATVASPTLSHSVRHRIFFYLGVLIVLLAFGAPGGGLIDIPITFFLKNILHLSHMRLPSSDSWPPSRFTCPLSSDSSAIPGIRSGLETEDLCCYSAPSAPASTSFFAFTAMTYVTLLVAVVLLTTSFLFVSSAQNGLTSTIGQQHAMSGQISAVWNIFASIPTVAALLIGGHLSDLLEGRNAEDAARMLFLVGAAIMVTVAIYATWKPQSVFDNIRAEQGPDAPPAGKSPKAGAALACLSGSADLVVVEFRAWFCHAAPVLPSEHTPRDGCPVGAVERHLRRVLHSNFRGVWRSQPKIVL